jgi:hypothetical protein
MCHDGVMVSFDALMGLALPLVATGVLLVLLGHGLWQRCIGIVLMPRGFMPAVVQDRLVMSFDHPGMRRERLSMLVDGLLQVGELRQRGFMFVAPTFDVGPPF